jgi:DNA-binding response OmpR family regulator
MHILIVEDDPVLADGLTSTLREAGYAEIARAHGADVRVERRVDFGR